MKTNYSVLTDSLVVNIVSADLYDTLGAYPNTKIFYFHHGEMLLEIDGKYERVPEKPLTYDLVSFSLDSIVPFEDSITYHSNQADYYLVGSDLVVELHDSQSSRVRLTDLYTGKVLKIFDHNTVDHISIFQKYLNHIGASMEEVKSMDNYLKSIQRTPLRIDRVYARSPNEIYLVATAAISYRVKQKRFIPSDYKKETIVVPKGEYISEDFGVLIRTDTSFSVNEVIVLDMLSNNDYNNSHFTDPTGGLIKYDDKFLFFAYNHKRYKDKTYKQFYNRNKSTQFVHSFTKQNNMLEFDKKWDAVLSRPLGEFYFYQEGARFVETEDHVFVMVNPFPEVYRIDQQRPIATLAETERDYLLKKNAYDLDQEEILPFYCYSAGFFSDHSVLMTITREEDRFFLSVFNSGFHLLQKLEITDELEIKEEMAQNYFYDTLSLLEQNRFNVIYCGSDGCKNYRYKIKFALYNSRAISKSPTLKQ